MAGVAFFFESNDVDVWSGRRVDFDAWNYAIKAAGDIDRAVIVNRTDVDISTFDADLDIRVEVDLPDLEDAVFVCCPWEANRCTRAVSLWEFNHEISWYVFGPANGWQRDLDFGVYVPQSGSAALHSVHIGSIVLLHRFSARRGA